MAAKRCKYCKHFKEIEVDISPSPFDGVCTKETVQSYSGLYLL